MRIKNGPTLEKWQAVSLEKVYSGKKQVKERGAAKEGASGNAALLCDVCGNVENEELCCSVPRRSAQR
jgi:hypothetical protein